MHYALGFYLLSTVLLLFWLYKPERSKLKNIGFLFLGVGFLTNICEILFEGQISSVFSVLSSIFSGIFFAIFLLLRRKELCKFSPVVATLSLIFYLLGLKVGTFKVSGLQITLHVIASILAFGLLLFSALFSALRSAAESKLKRGELSLPFGLSLKLWIELETKTFFFGFILLTADIVLNLIWLKTSKGSLACDPRVCSVFALWVYYWGLFHLRQFGVEPFKKRFHLFNTLGGIFVLTILLFAKHTAF